MASNLYLIESNDLECAICLESWMDKDPRILPCQHTFCLKCLQGFGKDSSIICPICRACIKLTGCSLIDLPRNRLQSILMKTDDNKKNLSKKCEKHFKEIIQPEIFCNTCKIENLCENCLENDHNNKNCKIIPFNVIKKKYENYKNDVNYEKLKENMNKMELIKKLDNYKEMKYLEVEEEFMKIKKQLEIYFDEKNKDLNNYLNNYKKLIINENQFEYYLNKLSNENLNINLKSEISIKANFQLNSDEYFKNINYLNKKFIKIENIENFPLYINLIRINDDGIFYTHQNQFYYIILKLFSGINDKIFYFSYRLINFDVIDDFLYGLTINQDNDNDDDNNEILFYRRYYDEYTILSSYKGLYDWISASKDDNGNRCLLARLINKKLQFFKNEQILWIFKNEYRIDYHFLNIYSTNSIISNEKCIFPINNHGFINEPIELSEEIIQIFGLPFGILILHRKDDGLHLKTLYLYSLDFKQRFKLIDCNSIYQVSSSGYVLLSMPYHRYVLFKIQ